MAVTITTITLPRNDQSRRGSVTPKTGLRGAAGGAYVGPLMGARDGSAIKGQTAGSHATDPFQAGGAEDSTGHRKSDTFNLDGNTGGLTGGPSSSVTRQKGGGAGATKTAFLGDGVQGGSTPGKPFDTAGRAADAGVDRFGRSLTGIAYPGGTGGRYTYTNYDKRSTNAGEGGRGAGIGGRGTSVATETVTIKNPPAPTFGAVASGVVAITSSGAGKITVDVATADLTGGANFRKGVEVSVFKRGTDTDEDGALVAVFTADGTTGATDAVTGLATGTYAVYARFIEDQISSGAGRFSKAFYGSTATPKMGPNSARTTLVVA